MNPVRAPIDVYQSGAIGGTHTFSDIPYDKRLQQSITATGFIKLMYDDRDNMILAESFREINGQIRQIKSRAIESANEAYRNLLNSPWHKGMFRPDSISGKDSVVWQSLCGGSKPCCVYIGEKYVCDNTIIVEAFEEEKLYTVLVSDNNGPVSGLFKISNWLFIIVEFDKFNTRVLEDVDNAITCFNLHFNEEKHYDFTLFYIDSLSKENELSD